ncbi:MAG: hypothetical protein ACREMT_10820, partial [Vulcanimicrobiaceae bacterium]
LKAGAAGKNVIVRPPLYLVQEILITNLFLFPIWAIGLVWLFGTAAYRFLAYAYVMLILEMLVFHGKHYYPANVYPILMAAGGVAIERWTAGAWFARAPIVAYALVLGPVFVPFSLPVLSEPAFLAYQSRIGAVLHMKRDVIATEHGRERTALPGDWADMHGWPELASAIKGVYDGLPADDRSKAVVLAANYGQASAIEFFAPGIPVVSGHNQFFLWGPGDGRHDVIIDVDGDCGAKEHVFGSAVLATRFNAPYTIGWETNLPIMVCRQPRESLAALWPRLKLYY